MNQFLHYDESLESQFRAIFLFGRNEATYKFALAKSILELSAGKKSFISLQELSPIFTKHMLEHSNSGKIQTKSKSSRYIQALQLYNQQQITYDQLMHITEHNAFASVIDAFHRIPNNDSNKHFFEKDVVGRKNGIQLTDELFNLNSSVQFRNLSDEVEGRWNLVEAAWSEKDRHFEVRYDHQLDELFLFRKTTAQSYMQSHLRTSLTAVRKPLNGYQKGKCFYCYKAISINSHDPNICDVDHFIPLSIQYTTEKNLELNGVWNLVLSCQQCNRGDDNGKFARLPLNTFLERLVKRNEYYIESNHPLKEMIIAITGHTVTRRLAYLKTVYEYAQSVRAANWQPKEQYDSGF